MQQQINFKPYLVEDNSTELSADQILIYSAVALGLMLLWLLVLLVWNMSLESRVEAADHRHNQLTQELSALGEAIAGDGGESLEHVKAQVAAKKALLARIKNDRSVDRINFSERLAGLGRGAIEGLWLDTITIDATGTQLKLGGQTIKAELVPRYLRGLSSDVVFKGLRFNMMTIEANRGDASKASGDTLNDDTLNFEVYALPDLIQDSDNG